MIQIIDNKMSIVAKQEICVQVHSIVCLASYPMGKYVIRFYVYHSHKGKNFFATPVSILEEKPSEDPTSQLLDNAYKTKQFCMKPNHTVTLNQLCIFKNQVNIFQHQDYKDINLNVVCELVRIDSNKENVLGMFYGIFSGINGHDFMLVDFGEAAACQLTGTIHSCAYQYQFQSNSSKFDTLEEFCSAQSSDYVDHLSSYLLLEEKFNLKAIQKAFREYSTDKQQKKKEKMMMEMSEQSILDEKKQKDLFRTIKQESLYRLDVQSQPSTIEKDLETRANEPQLNDIQQQLQNAKKRKRRIFDRKQTIEKVKEKKSTNFTIFQKCLHEKALEIYSVWRQFIGILHRPHFQSLLEQMYQKYMNKVKKLMGESVVRFAGSRDIDIYADEVPQRNKIALQARTFLGQVSRENNEFVFYNNNFFSNQRPIFFQELLNEQKNKEQVQIAEQILIVLVHGLGACRLDMEKMKVELKRYLGKRARILVSMSNEGRTEGDIDAMGVRLALEVDHEVTKIKKPIPITFIGHSMGGVIIRSALPRLSKHAKLFNSYISFSTPHIGYSYSSSKLVDAGLWLLNHWKKCQAILQLTISDKADIQQSFLYKLSKAEGFEHFKKVALFGSHQDLYVPYYSARIQKHQDCITDCKNKVEKGKIHSEMIDNILGRIKGKLYRTDINFCIPEQNLDNLIGRAAHISFVQNLEMLRILCLTDENIIF